MNSLVLAVEPNSTVQEALSIMDKHVVRQIIVSSNAVVLGMISRDDIFEKIRLATISTAAYQSKSDGTKDTSTAKLTCPYCELPFDSKQALSTHIDRLHTVTGVLEGDVRRMFE